MIVRGVLLIGSQVWLLAGMVGVNLLSGS
jgi:hypothetical protein